MPNEQPKVQPETTAITSGRDASGSLAPTLWSSTTWQSAGLDESTKHALATHKNGNYARYSNPTVRSFEESVAALEGAEDALAFASGMGAVSSVILALCSSGDHIVAHNQLYGGTIAFLNGPCARLGIDVTYVDGSKPGALAAAVRPGKTMLVIAESPSNPQMGLVDLAELGAIKGPFTLVDSTLATPMGQRPLDFGIDIVLHSATKGIDGHNDALLGVIAGEKDLIDSVWGYAVMHGAVASPYDAANGLRGIRTLGVRTERQNQTALILAHSLEGHAKILSVSHPFLESHPQHQLAREQMRLGGTVIAVEVAGGFDACQSLVSQLQVVRIATSFGGPETLVCHPATSTHVGLSLEALATMGVTDGLLRFSIGLEDADDLVDDLHRAIATL